MVQVEGPGHLAALCRRDRFEPFLAVLASVYCGLSPLVISANTHRIWLVILPQAKLTWPGSDATFGFWQAVVISLWTVATLAATTGSASAG